MNALRMEDLRTTDHEMNSGGEGLSARHPFSG